MIRLFACFRISRLTSILFAFVLLIGGSVEGQTQLFLEDFEDATVGYTTSVTEFSDGDFDYFTNTVNNSIGSVDFTNVQGSEYFAAQDIDGEGATLPVSVNIDDINISGYTDITFKVYLAEDDDGTNQDWDAADYVHFTYDIDNTGSYSNLLWIESELSSGTNGKPLIDTDFDGVGDGTEITDNFAQFSVSIPSTGSDLDIQIEFYLDSGDEDIAIDHIEVYGTSAGPTITLSETNLTGFTYEVGSGPSTEQTFTVSGINLTNDISITAPTNYEISKTSGSAYTSPLNFTQSGGTVNATTVYVRLKASLSAGDYNNEDITASSNSATSQTVECDGTVSSLGANETISIMNYNILNYVKANGTGDCDQTNNDYTTKGTYMQTIIGHAAPDILGVEEMQGGSGGQADADEMHSLLLNILDASLGYSTGDWARLPYSSTMDNEYISSQLYWNTNKFTWISTNWIDISGGGGTSRDVPVVQLRFYKNDNLGNPIDLYVMVAHLTPSSGASNEAIRDSETAYIRSYLDANLNSGENMVLLGDFNMYHSTEAGYQNLVAGAVELTDFNDPINRPGTWTSNSSFQDIHTQCTRITAPGGCGATGGSDDRFDFILLTDNIIAGTDKVSYVSYETIGQDGLHYNDDINNGTNASAPAAVISALFNNSDHLPVKCELEFEVGATLLASETILNGFIYEEGIGPSAEQSFDLSGSGLDGTNVVVTAPVNYEVSKTSGGTFASSQTYTAYDGTSTTIYVRLKTGLTAASGPYNETLIISGGGATNISVNLEGIVSYPGSIGVHSFEASSDTWTPATLSTPSCSSGGDVWDYVSSLNTITPNNGSLFWGMSDITGNCGTSPETYALPNLDVSGYNTITLSFDYFTESSWDSGDDLFYEIFLDNVSQGSIQFVDGGDGTTSATDAWVTVSENIPDGTNNVRITFTATQNGPDYGGLDFVRVVGTPNGPELTTSVSSLTGFTYEVGSGPSTSQSFDLSGSLLDGSQVTVSAGTNYEVSLDNSGFSNSVNVGYTAPDLSATTIYVRLKSGLSVNTYNSVLVTCSDNGTASDVTVSNNGEVIAVGGGPCASDLIISEYVEGSGSEKYIEIYNGTGSSIDLSDYKLQLYTNGSPTTTNDITLSGTLNDGNVIVYQNSSASLYSGTNNAAVNFNGDDAVALYKISTSSFVDIFGKIGEDPGSAWTSTSNSTVNKTLVRNSDVVNGITSNPTSGFETLESEWTQYNEDVVSNLGSHTMTCDPTITVDPTVLSGFTYSEGSGPSSEQSFTISGANLIGNINIIPPTNYEISTGSGGSFVATNPITLTQSGGDVTETTIYVRLKAGLSGGDYNSENITASSASADDKTVSCSGYVCSDPTTQTSALSFPDTQTDQMDVLWTSGNGDYRLVVASLSAITGTPSDNTTYSADAAFNNGQDVLNAGEYVVYAGNGNSFTMTGLDSDTEYFIKVFEYNCDSGSEQYLTSSPLAGSETTVANIPAVTGFDVICTTETTATVEWTNPSSGDWDGVIIAIRNSTNPVHTLSDDPTTVSADAVFGDGHEFGTTTPYSYVVYKGTGTSVTITGLTQGQEYSLKAISYYGSLIGDETTTTISSLEIAEVTAASTTTENSQTSISWSNPGSCYDEILVVGHNGSSVSSNPSGDGSAYTANSVFGSGTDIGTNEYVVYKGSSTSVIVTSLTNGNSYYFTIFVRTGTEWSSGVEVIANPADVTIFIPGDMAIIAVNTNNATIGEEFTFVTFKDITVGTSIDFTDNGWQQENPDSWGTTEGTMRLTRISGGTLPAGTSVTVIMNSGNGDDQPDFDINVGGVDELGTNWSITLLNSSEGTGFNLNSDDEIWLMQGGSWLENDVTSGDPVNDDDEYTGYVLYGWTATGWGTGTSTKKSDLYPACECFNTNVSGISNKDKVKYIGPMTDVTKLDWIMRFNNVSNWTGYADDASYDAATPDYRGTGVTIGITNGGFESGRWTAGQNTDWFDCGNWQNLTIPDEETNVVISTTYASDDAVINNSENALCYDLTIESEIGLDFSNNTIEVHGSFINQSASITSANGTLLLASDDNVNVTSNGVSLYNVEVNGNGNFTLIDNLTLTGTFNLVNGFIETGANQIFVNNTAEAAITNYTAASYINGNLRRAITGAGSYDFPVGDASNFELATVDITSATSLSYLDAHFASADLGNINIVGLGLQVAGTSLVSVLDAGYWEIEPNTGASVDYDIEVNLAGASNVAADAEQHAVIKRDNASSDWELHGSHDNATQSIVAGVVTAKVSGLNAFSQFAIARSNQWVLAVELVDFSVKCETAGLSVNWTTVSEDNADYFMIEYSSDTRTWEMLQKLPAFGSTYVTQEYQILLEDSPRKGYYRLAEVDMDGTVTHYAPAYVNCLDKDKQAMITVSPNPANNFVQLSAVKTTSNLYLVAIYDATGKLVNMLTWENPVEQELTLDLYGFAPGYYQLKIYNEREFYNKKLLVK